MGFIDPRMTSSNLPERWEEFDLHVEVNSKDFSMKDFLHVTNWEHFADGGFRTESDFKSNQKTNQNNNVTHWYGLKRPTAETYLQKLFSKENLHKHKNDKNI
jgi:hypothetical protein